MESKSFFVAIGELAQVSITPRIGCREEYGKNHGPRKRSEAVTVNDRQLVYHGRERSCLWREENFPQGQARHAGSALACLPFDICFFRKRMTPNTYISAARNINLPKLTVA